MREFIAILIVCRAFCRTSHVVLIKIIREHDVNKTTKKQLAGKC